MVTSLYPSRLVCPNDCGAVAPNMTHGQIGGGQSTMHQCKSLAGMVVPLIPEGQRAEARAHEREDYEGSDLTQRDANDRPIMAVSVTRDDGEDRVVFAPTIRETVTPAVLTALTRKAVR